MDKQENIVALLLAAGSSSRFGKDKLLQLLPNKKTVVATTVENYKKIVPNVVAVIRPNHAILQDELESLDIRVVVNQEPDSGMASSIVTGINATTNADGWLIALADMPWVKTATILGLKEKLLAGKSIVAPVHKKRRGNPVGFSRQWQSELQKLQGDMGAKQLLLNFPDKLFSFDTDDEGILMDIDYPDDLYQEKSSLNKK